MGNYFMRCCVGVAVIRVMRPNGRVDEFDFPVTAAEVMRRYPEHLVIQSTYNFSQENTRRKVSIVQPETKLLPGHEYILYQIPSQYRETVAQSFARKAQNSSDSDIDEDNDFQQQQQQQYPRKRVSTRAQILGATRHHLASILKSTRDVKVSDEEWCVESPPTSRMTLRGRMEVEERSKVVGDEDEEKEEEEEFSFYYGASWKPSLCSIPESPISPSSSPVSSPIVDRPEHW